MNNTEAHQKLVQEILLKIGSHPQIRLWPRVVGKFRYLYQPGIVKINIVGEPDLDGIISPHGRRLGIECKSGGGILSKDQILYKAMIEKFGGIYIVARDSTQTLQELQKYL